MRKPLPLASWDAAITAYLANRRALGRGYHHEEWILAHLRGFLARAGAADLDQALFDQWRAQYYAHSTSARFAYEHAAYNFCRYRRRGEPGCFLPDRASLARTPVYPLPTLIEPQQVARLLSYASGLCPGSRSPVRGPALRLALVLLYTAGLRRGEVVRLTLADVDASTGVLHVRESKFHKSRWVPLSNSACAELQTYLQARRDAGLDVRPGAPLLCTARTRAYSGGGFYRSLKNAMLAMRICDSSGRCPRVQDFRHSFAVAALLRWYEQDADVQANLPKLALYMGHVSIVSTAYYLRLMPAVVAKASERFGRACADVLEGGVS